MKAVLPKNEAMRLAALHEYAILDTEPEGAFDDITNLAAQICGTPIGLINLVDEKRQWLKSKVGLNLTELPCDVGLCHLCIEQGETVVINDTLSDRRSETNLVVTSSPYVRFYAGVPLIVNEGYAIGTLCVVDYVPRELSLEQIAALQALSRQIVSQLELRRSLAEVASVTLKYKQAEEVLQRQLAAVEAAIDGIAILNRDSEYIYLNKAHVELFGYNSASQLLGKTWKEFYYPDEISRFEGDVFPILQQQGYWRGEATAKRKDGSTFAEEVALTIAEDGSLIYVCRDISQRKSAEESLRWQEALLRSMTCASPIAFYVVDNRSDDILYFNRRFCEIWGIEHLEEQMLRGEVKNQDIIPHCLPLLADIPAFADSCKPLQSEFFRCVVEDEIPFADGRTIRRFSSQVRDEQDRYFGRLYLFEDISDRKQAVGKMREQAALLDVTTDAILVRDLSHRILFWNQGAQRLYGWLASEVMGKNAIEFLYKDVPNIEVALKTVTLVGEWSGELEKVTKSGKEIVVESRWTLVQDERGQPKSILCVDTDITEKKQLATQLLRTQRLESIGTLASGIAHDLNNVLTPILISAQLLRLKVKEERNQQLLATVENNAKRGASLIKQVLSFARGVEGKHTVLQIRHLIAEFKQIAKQTFPKSIAVYTDVPPDLWTVLGDATQLHQVLMNLCVNARDAMPNGGTLKITAENIFIDENYARMHLEAKVGHYIAIAVADNGTGMTEEVKERIFEPFFTTKELGHGTGLGLSTVMGIVKGHGGFVNVYSDVGKGTQFKVYLPAVGALENKRSPEVELVRGNQELILLVDDEPAIRDITKISLETHNYQVITASDGIEAIALYVQHRHQISLVLVDFMMPSMDGFTTIRTLQKINPSLKVIVMSGLASNAQMKATCASGVQTFLPKPYTTEELLKAINEVLNVKSITASTQY